MISLILPYWDRQQAADKALTLLAQTYSGVDLEVVIVDDGSGFVRPDVDLNIKLVTLPAKSVPKCPTTAWNAGVAAATADLIVLSCIEILHEQPVLEQMAQAVREMGPDGYVLAAAWCPEHNAWHCHSTVPVPDCPDGSGIAFCAALHRSLFVKAGGFDEDYREGAGYEDRDFVLRLHRAGAQFVIRDDLVVTHPKSGATIPWEPGGFEKNEALFYSKWEQVTRPVTFVCLKAGTAYGPEYVNILFDMVSRNLPAGTYRFSCLTDDPTGIGPGIGIMPLPADLETWWGKLYLFRPGAFPDGTRVVFFDLDTLVVGNIGKLVQYSGPFATLNDFYQPHRVGPAVMMWEAGNYTTSIWEEWVACGKPRHPMGDLWWIGQLDQGRFAHRADKLQDLYPGAFVSFKAHCKPYPPKDAKVVCFHGQPRPHNCTEEWVQNVWRIGGSGMAQLEIVANTARETVMRNVRINAGRDCPWLDLVPEHGGSAIIVGGGPSVSENLDVIRCQQEQGAMVVALNGAAPYLKRHGILADWQVILDARPENAAFVLPEVPQHFISSQCDPLVFERLTHRPTLFHVNTQSTIEALPKDRQAHLISTGSTVGLIAMGILYTQGFRLIGIYGMDSSYTEKHHAYEQKLNDDDRVIEAVAVGRTFRCAPWMVAQVNEFQEVALQLAQSGCTITVAGDGLLPWVARHMTASDDDARIDG